MRFSRRALLNILDLCATFLLDASVLIFVFPILDTIVEHGKQNLTRQLISYTLAISGVFFVAAIVMAILKAGKEAE